MPTPIPARTALSIADEAVWPRPQIEASRIAWPISARRCSSSARDPFGRARREPGQELLLADRADPAGHALAARLVAEERGDPAQRAGEVDRLVEDHDHPGSERRIDRPGAFERQRRVERLGSDEDPGRPAEQDRPDRLRPWPTPAAAGTPPASSSSCAQGRPERDLVDSRPGDVAGEAEELRPGRAFGPDRGIGRAAVAQDQRNVGERLDVVDRGGLAEQPDLDRERRLVARLAALALDRVEEGRLLAADVGAGADPQLDVERELGAEDLGAEQAGRPRLADRVRSGARRRAGTRRGGR